MHEHALETREPSYVPRTAKPFFIPVVQPWETWQHRSSPLEEVEFRAMGHVEAPEPTSAGKRGPELRDTWQSQSSPQQGGEVHGRDTRGGIGAHLCREVWSEVTTYVVARGCTFCSLS
jgi:hypothetical protein